jgi:hypothetical protein
MMTYRANAFYLLLAGIAAACVALLGWWLLRSSDLGTVLFFCLGLGLLLLALRNAGSRVEADALGLTVFRPLAAPLRIQYRQIAQVTEESRLQRSMKAIVVLYYPLGADGLVDLEDLRSQALPALENQTELLHVLQTKTPH